MLRPYLRIKALPPALPVIREAREPFPYLRGRVCANEGMIFFFDIYTQYDLIKNYITGRILVDIYKFNTFK